MKKILIVKLGAIGDVIQASSMINSARKTFPDCNITWIVGRMSLPILKLLDNVDSIIDIDEKNLLTGNYFDKSAVVFDVWKQIAFKKYDLILIPYFDKKYHILTALTFRKLLRTFNHSNRLNTPVKGRYFSNEFAKMIDGIDDFRMHAPEIPKINFKSEIKLSYQPDENNDIIIAPGGAKNFINYDELRRWPIKNYVTLTKMLLDKGFNVILTGAPSDEYVIPYFKDLGVLNLVGKTTLEELVYLYTQSKLLITHDTGPFHLSKLTNINVVGLFGPTNPKTLIDVNDEKIKVFWGGEKLYCSPCFDGKNFADCSNNICMKNIKPEKVFEVVMQVMK